MCYECTISDLQEEVEKERDAKNGAYKERNRLVALLATLYPSSLEPHEGEDWGPDWKWVCHIELPTGLVSWHIMTDELDWFRNIPRNQGRKWDGYTTEEKYDRVMKMLGLDLPF